MVCHHYCFALPLTHTPSLAVSQRLTYTDAQPSYPLIMDLAVVRDDHRTLQSDAHLASEVARLRSLHPRDCKFVLRMVPKSCTDLEALNATALAVQRLVTDLPLLLEATVERLLVLSSFADSVFLKGNVYPAVKYFLQAGQEEQCVAELRGLFVRLTQFKGACAVVAAMLMTQLMVFCMLVAV